MNEPTVALVGNVDELGLFLGFALARTVKTDRVTSQSSTDGEAPF